MVLSEILPTEVSPQALCLKKAENLQQLLVFLHYEIAAHITELRESHFSYSRCVMSVCLCEHWEFMCIYRVLE